MLNVLLSFKSKEALISHNKANRQQSTSLPANEVTLNELDSQSTTSSTDQSSDLTGFPCEVFGKVMKSKQNLDNHLQKVHSQAILISDSFSIYFHVLVLIIFVFIQ